MKTILVPALAILAGTGSALQAQQPRLGVSLNLVLPTGNFNSHDGLASYTGDPALYRYSQGYDVGLGGQFTISFPVDPKLAFRLNFGGQVTDGTYRDDYPTKLNLRHTMFSVGGDMQFFTQSAYRHRGTYFLAGVSADFERFESTSGDFDYYYDNNVDTVRKSRLGGNFGIGHTFGFDAGTRFTLEVTYHTTLTGRDVGNSLPEVAKSTDFVRVGFGWVF
jgi:hypothetical protein